MALIAFDGTWNKDETEVTHDTNVAHWCSEYDGEVDYVKGVGTRLGEIGKIVGGFTGAGALDRVNGALDAYDRFRKGGDSVVDVVGFSRGAALALDFCNRLQGRYSGPNFQGAGVRFLGLFDVVASFGLPGNSINLGHDLRLADLVRFCAHAMALDERRDLFPQTRPKRRNPAATEPPLYEVWFRGVHSDIGGGNGKAGLSSIALTWMMRRAAARGVKFKPGAIERWSAQRDPDEPLFKNAKMGLTGWRKPFPSDVVHESVRTRAGGDCQDPLPTMSVVNDDGAYLPKTWGERAKAAP